MKMKPTIFNGFELEYTGKLLASEDKRRSGCFSMTPVLNLYFKRKLTIVLYIAPEQKLWPRYLRNLLCFDIRFHVAFNFFFCERQSFR